MPPDIDMLRLQIGTLLRENPDLEEDEQLRADMLEGCTDYKEVLERLLKSEKHFDWLITGLSGHIQQLVERRNSLKDRRAGVRNIIMSVMGAANMRKAEFPIGSISIIKTGRSVQILDENLIPEELCRIKREPNKTAIKDALFAGEPVPGATLNNGSETIRIV
jgi:Siphovirus Gp157